MEEGFRHLELHEIKYKFSKMWGYANQVTYVFTCNKALYIHILYYYSFAHAVNYDQFM